MPNEGLLEISMQAEKDIGYVRLVGRLMAESRFELERLLRLWNEQGLNRMIVSCSELDYIDSGGLSTLIAALHRMRRAGGDLVLNEINPSLNALFELTTMMNHFLIFSSIEEATQHFERDLRERRKKARARKADAKAKKARPTAKRKTEPPAKKTKLRAKRQTSPRARTRARR